MKENILSIILPTYNEIGNIGKLIKSVKSICDKHRIVYEILVVDDNSPDGTGKKAQQLSSVDHRIKTFIRINNKGLATAILCGIKRCHGNMVLVMDTDFNHHPKYIPRMYQLIQDYDLIIGSRFVKNGGMENYLRYWFSYSFNIFIRLLLNNLPKDNLSGYFMIRRKCLFKLPLNRIFFNFGDYFIRLIYYVQKHQYSLTEIPVFYPNRRSGESKTSFFSIFIKYLFATIKLKLAKNNEN